MARLPFEEVNIYCSQTRPANKQVLKAKLHTGLDTETLNGYVRLICDDEENSLLIKNKETGFRDIVKFLTRPRFKNTFNWFYNIQYDFESIVKYLPKEDLIDLYNDGEVNFVVENPSYNAVTRTERSIDVIYKIQYMKRKYFGISCTNNYYHFYDLFNFMDVSLNNASKRFLGKTKNNDVDSSRLNLDLDYWNDNQEIIKKYCIQDCKLTQELAVKFWGIMDANLKLVPKRPFSKGKLSEEYFLKMCKIPTVNSFISPANKKILEYSYKSFYGGRFELLKRGYFPKVYCYDIKSAYPTQMKELIDFDFAYGRWNFVKDISPDAYEGWYRATVITNELNFAPLVYKANHLNIYPNGKFNQYLLKSEIDFIRENFDNTTIKIVDGVEFFAKEFVYPFKEEIEKLYKWKDTEKDEDIKQVVKIILNSIYGKTIQISENATNDIGNLFNPMYASIITSKTRMKLLELALQKPESVVMFSTDGLHTTEPLHIPKSPKLGDFAKDFTGEGVYLMSDVYNLWTDKQVKNKIRGFNAGSTKDKDSETKYLKDILAGMKTDTYEYISSRPIHLGEALIHNIKHTPEDINIWQDVERKININGDMKRVWDKDFKNGKECLKISIDSLPILVGED